MREGERCEDSTKRGRERGEIGRHLMHRFSEIVRERGARGFDRLKEE